MHCILNNRWLYAASLLLICLSAHSKNRWISFDDSKEGTQPSIETIISNNSEHYVKISFHGIFVDDVIQNNIKYNKLSFGSLSSITGNVGMPALPQISQTIAIPQGCKYSCSIIKEDSTEINIGRIYPVLRPIKESEKEVFEINDSVYSQETYSKAVLSLGEEQIYRSIRNIGVHVCPFKYSPLLNKLTVYRTIYLKIQFTKQPATVDSQVVQNDPVVRRMFDNTIDFPLTTSSVNYQNTQDYDYLIIVGDDSVMYHSQILKDFCKWKAYKGHKTKVVSTSEIGTSSQGIKNYISSEYNNYNIKYVLFVGNQILIDPYTIYLNPRTPVPSDYWYACMDGDNDFEADIAIGRFSTNLIEDLSNMINKSIQYEQTSTECSEKAILIAHKEEAPGKFQALSNDIYESTYNNPLQFTKIYGAPTHLGGTNATNSDIAYHINSGVGIVNYRGHGDSKRWDRYWSSNNVAFTIDDVCNLSNSIYPVVFSIACSTSDVYNSICLMEEFMRQPIGSSAFLGATVETATATNNYYASYLFDNLLNWNVYKFGYLSNLSHLRTLCQTANTNNYQNAKIGAMAYICGGDPSLEIFTQKAKSFENVTTEENNGVVVITTDSICGFTASVVSTSGELLYYASSISDTLCLQNVPSDAQIVLNKQNYIPYEIRNFVYIQNSTIADNQSYNGYITKVGTNVTTEVPTGNVFVENGGNLRIHSDLQTQIKGYFKCKRGGKLYIK